MFAEVCLRGDAQYRRTFAPLGRYKRRFGLDLWDAIRTAAGLAANQIPRFVPFADPASRFTEMVNKAIDTPNGSLLSELRQHAEQVKKNNLRFGELLLQRSLHARELLRRNDARKYASFGDAWKELAEANDSFLERLVYTLFTNDARDVCVTSEPARLFKAVTRNPHFTNFFGTLLFYLVSVSRLWQEQRLNLDAVLTRDDWSDVCLTLYVGKHDIVVSADKALSKALKAVDPTRRVIRADEL